MMANPPGSRHAATSADDVRLHDLWQTVASRRWTVLGVAIGVILLGGAITLLQTPEYQSAATVRVDERDSPQNFLTEMMPLAMGGRGKIETEMEVIRSLTITETVADSLHLHVEVLEPRGSRSSFVRILHAPRDAPEGTFTLRRRDDQPYEVALRGNEVPIDLPEAVRPGTPFQLGTVTLELEAGVRLPNRIRIRVHPFDDAVDDLRKALWVARTNPDAQIIRVGYQGPDATLAAAVPNLFVQSFMRYKAATSRTEASSTVQFLREQVASYDQDLQAAETRLREFRERARVVSPRDEASAHVLRLAEIRSERDRLEGERSTLARLLAQTNAARRDPTDMSPYRQLAAFPAFITNRGIQEVLLTITQLENERADRLLRRRPENESVMVITNRIQELEGQLHETAQNYLGSLNNQLASIDANLGRFASELDQIPEREMSLARLAREQALLEEISTLLQTRLKEAEIREAVSPGDVRVIDLARVARKPVSPRPLRNMFIAVFLGVAFGVGAAFVREAMDTKVHTRDDVAQATGGIPVLGVIPRFDAATAVLAGANGNGRNGAGRLDPRGGRVPPPEGAGGGAQLITMREPRSPVSEAYRALRTSITFAGAEKPPQVVLVTSAMPGDGKSVSSSNLAVTLAQQGTRVLLIDADLRKGVLHQLFGVRQDPGLTNALLMGRPVEEIIHEIPLAEGAASLHFMGSGPRPPNPAELLGGPRMREFLADLRGRYEAVVIDAPPLNLVTDAAILGTFVDASILVTRSGVTDKRALEQAAAHMQQVHARVAGVVLNDVRDMGRARYYGYGSYGDGA